MELLWTTDEDNTLYYVSVPVGSVGITEKGDMIARLSCNNSDNHIDLTEHSMSQLNQLLEAVKLNWQDQLNDLLDSQENK